MQKDSGVISKYDGFFGYIISSQNEKCVLISENILNNEVLNVGDRVVFYKEYREVLDDKMIMAYLVHRDNE